jgi:hypothetical protein
MGGMVLAAILRELPDVFCQGFAVQARFPRDAPAFLLMRSGVSDLSAEGDVGGDSAGHTCRVNVTVSRPVPQYGKRPRASGRRITQFDDKTRCMVT